MLGRVNKPEEYSPKRNAEGESRVQGVLPPAGVKGQSPLWEFEGEVLKLSQH